MPHAQLQSEEKYKQMTETPIPKLILRLGIPTIASMLITSVYNMTDTYFVGQLGKSASGAIGIVFSLMAIFQAFGFMFGHGAGSNISRRLGQHDVDSATRFASTGFFLALLMGAVIGVFGLLFLTPLMYLLGSTETILPFARDYGMWILLAGPIFTGSCVLNNILRYEGMSFLAMIGLVSGGFLNMILDPILIFLFDMGTSGAGLSTAISQAVSFLILLYMFLAGRTESKLKLSKVTRQWQEIWLIVATGLPSLIRQGLASLSGLLLNHQAGIYGDAAVAAMSIVNRITSFIFSVGLGMGQGYQPVAAFNYGAKIYSRVRKGFWFTGLAGEGPAGNRRGGLYCLCPAAGCRVPAGPGGGGHRLPGTHLSERGLLLPAAERLRQYDVPERGLGRTGQLPLGPAKRPSVYPADLAPALAAGSSRRPAGSGRQRRTDLRDLHASGPLLPKPPARGPAGLSTYSLFLLPCPSHCQPLQTSIHWAVWA